MGAWSPGLAAGPHMAIIRASSSPLGESFPSFKVRPVLPMGNGERTYTNSALKVRIRSIRVCFERRGAAEDFWSSAVKTARDTRRKETRSGRQRDFIGHPGPITLSL